MRPIHRSSHLCLEIVKYLAGRCVDAARSIVEIHELSWLFIEGTTTSSHSKLRLRELLQPNKPETSP